MTMACPRRTTRKFNSLLFHVPLRILCFYRLPILAFRLSAVENFKFEQCDSLSSGFDSLDTPRPRP